MAPKNLKYALLCDTYGELLSEKHRSAVEMYYSEDLSLSEIAEHMGITRQGVRDQIKHAEEELDRFESCLGLYGKNTKLRDLLEGILQTATAADNLQIIKLCEKALTLLDT